MTADSNSSAALEKFDGSISLDDIRENITRIDKEMLKLLAERREYSVHVAKTKVNSSKPVRDPEREEALLLRLMSQGEELKLDPTYVLRLFRTIIEDSCLVQQAYLQTNINGADKCFAGKLSKIAFLGPEGSYSYQASRSFFARKDTNLVDVSCSNFREILTAVAQEKADFGILPIENACSGTITDVYDQLRNTTLSIVGEVTQDIDHCLLVPESSEATLDDIATIYSHPQPFLQCSEFLDTLERSVTKKPTKSTAAAMEIVAKLNCPTEAAIGSATSASRYGLKPLRENISNYQHNWTRFIVVAKTAVEVTTLCPAKTTVLMVTGQYPGALVHCLELLKSYNMTMLESRPNKPNSGEYMFFVDIMGNTQEEGMQKALDGLKQRARFFQVLGCYPIENVKPTEFKI